LAIVVGDDVTVQCTPSDISYIIEWEYSYGIVGGLGSISIPPMDEGSQITDNGCMYSFFEINIY